MVITLSLIYIDESSRVFMHLNSSYKSRTGERSLGSRIAEEKGKRKKERGWNSLKVYGGGVSEMEAGEPSLCFKEMPAPRGFLMLVYYNGYSVLGRGEIVGTI
jgi:hypothetical protein